MGMWIAAARLGLGLGLVLGSAGANVKQKIGSVCVRRFSCLLADPGKNSRSQSLYLCFSEEYWGNEMQYEDGLINHVVRSIQLNTSANSDDDDAGELLVIDSQIRRCYDAGRFTSFGSKIILPVEGESHIFCLDTLKSPPKFERSSPVGSDIISFSKPKRRLKMGEIDGKLYSIGLPIPTENLDPCNFEENEFLSNPSSAVGKPSSGPNSFEVFEAESSRWKPLAEPLFQYGPFNFLRKYYTVFLDESRKILGWVQNEHRVFCFDATNPQNKWIELDHPLIQATIPFTYNSLFILTCHPKIGEFHIVFTYDPVKDPLMVNLYFMSKTCDSFHPIGQPIQLQEVCSSYTKPPLSFRFLHLGDKKAGLLINTFHNGEGHLLLVTFEFDIDVTVEDTHSRPDIQVKTRFLQHRRFRYPPILDFHEAMLDGAFLCGKGIEGTGELG